MRVDGEQLTAGDWELLDAFERAAVVAAEERRQRLGHDLDPNATPNATPNVPTGSASIDDEVPFKEKLVVGLRAAAQTGGLSPAALHEQISRGTFPVKYERDDKGRYVFRRDDLEALRSTR